MYYSLRDKNVSVFLQIASLRNAELAVLFFTRFAGISSYIFCGMEVDISLLRL